MSACAQHRRAGVGLRFIVAAIVAALAVVLAATASVARATQPVQLAPTMLEGPFAPGGGPTALTSSIARDGSGALVFLAPAGGVQHIYASLLVGGSFQAPVQVDAGLGGASSQPRVAAGPGGALVVAFLSGSALYVAQRRSAPAGLSAPRALAVGAANPALAMSTYGKAYLAFTVPDGAGSDVRVAFNATGAWAIERSPLNINRGDDAGSATARPAIAAAGDGVAIVAWGEDGHIFTRRVWGTQPSTMAEQADTPPAPCTETWADEPAVGSGGDSSYAAVAFRESMVCAGQTVSRVLVNRLHASHFDGQTTADGALGLNGGAGAPAVAVGEYGSGWVTSEGVASNDVEALRLAQPEAATAASTLNALPDASPPAAVPTMAGLYSSLVAWQHDPGAGAPPEIRARYADGDMVFGPELLLSVPASGPSNAGAGLTAGGDIVGDAAVAWVQSSAAGDELFADELVRAPSPPQPIALPGYQRTTRPTLSWIAGVEPWGPLRYNVALDGAPLAQTTATSLTVPAPVAQGRHSWQLTAVNQAGLTAGTQSGSFFVDSQPPAVTLALGHNRTSGRPLRLIVSATDHPAPLPASAASGLATLVVSWGDGTIARLHGPATHVYLRPGRYRITVVAVDRAGNATTESMVVRIKAPPKPKPKKKKKKGGSSHA